MEWLRISTSNTLLRVATDEVVCVRADGNYCDITLSNGKSRTLTFQLHFFDEIFQQLHNNTFVRIGRSLIVNKRYIHFINLTEQVLVLYGGELKEQIVFSGLPKNDKTVQYIVLSRDALKQLKELLEEEKGVENG